MNQLTLFSLSTLLSTLAITAGSLGAAAAPPAEDNLSNERAEAAEKEAAAAQNFERESRTILDPTFDKWKPGWFFSQDSDIGLLYLRPRGSIGYGKPFTKWVGIDFNPVISFSTPQLYAGLRFALPSMDLRVGARGVYSFYRAALPLQDRYEQDEVDLRVTDEDLSPQAAYMSVEAEYSYDLDAGPGFFAGELYASYILLSPEGRAVFEERVSIITDTPWVLKARAGYGFSFDVNDVDVEILPSAEVLWATGRPGETVRAGALIQIPLTSRLSVRGNYLATVVSPDDIGFTGMEFGQLNLRWREAWGL